MGTLYRLNFSDGKTYIGATTKSIKTRFSNHRSAAKIGRSAAVSEAWRVIGEPSLEVLAIVENSELPATEALAVTAFGTLVPNGYNMLAGGGAHPSTSRDVVERIAQKKRGVKGRKHSEETKARMRVVQANRVLSPDALRRISEANKGKKRSAETCARISAAKRNPSAETRRRMSESGKARHRRNKS